MSFSVALKDSKMKWLPEKPAYHDYSNDVKLTKNPVLRLVWHLLAGFFLVLGFIGIFLPILPTTPFILLSALLYAKSSIHFYNWLMNHRFFGPPLRDWKDSGSINLYAKILAISIMTLTIGPTVTWLIPLWPVKILVALIGISVALFVVTRPLPSKQKE